jgi:hypothetical protein
MFSRDLVERAVATWVQAWLGLVIVGWTGAVDVDLLSSAAFSTVPAFLSVVKSGVASRVGTGSASLDPLV